MESKKDKFRQTLLDLVDSGKYIPGIYNYCDRWCERCTLSHKCLTFAHEQEIKEECNDPETNSLSSEKFWEQISLSFEVALDMISEDARRLGINLDELPVTEEPETIESPVEVMADEYSSAMEQWLKVNNELLKTKDKQLLKGSFEKKSGVTFAEAVEVLQWYCYFISAKIHRSYFELDSRLQEEADGYDLLSDNNGSAKIALIAINRSIEAFTVIYPEMADQEDEILGFMNQLSKIKNKLLVDFPSAMEFRRPGFDE